jgi:hypothetical protein
MVLKGCSNDAARSRPSVGKGAECQQNAVAKRDVAAQHLSS